ncbi:MAG TPA: ATP-grasp domain-containing protein [Pyrinomonadaceae bacterium]|nr:ATP-grasp domain-containing protein [Pyrinomonadaceae bacterium]
MITNKELLGLNYIPYGSTELIKKCYELGFKGVYFNPLHDYREALTNQVPMLNSQIISVEELLKLPDNELFVRPIGDLKLFNGQVYEIEDLQDLLNTGLSGGSSKVGALQLNDEVIISQPQWINAEYRTFIVNRKVISICRYKTNGRLNPSQEVPQEIKRFADFITNGWLPNDNVVVDICSLDNTFKVVEFNCINCAGFYRNDMKSVFQALIKYGNEIFEKRNS